MAESIPTGQTKGQEEKAQAQAMEAGTGSVGRVPFSLLSSKGA